MKKKTFNIFVLFVLLANLLSACVPVVEDFTVGDGYFNALLEITTYPTELTQRLELHATINQGFPRNPYYFFSVGVDGSMNRMTCSPPALDQNGQASVDCVLTLSKDYRQYAIALGFGDSPEELDLTIQDEYRAKE